MDRMEKKLAKQLEKSLKADFGKSKVIISSKKIVKGFDTYQRNYTILLLKPKEEVFYLVRVIDEAISIPYASHTDKDMTAALRKVLYKLFVKK